MNLFELHIADVWVLLGGKLRANGHARLRAPAFWRGSRDLNIAIDTQKNVWYDHVTQRGGGLLALVEVARDCDQSGALRWLETYAGLDPSHRLSPAEESRRRIAQHEAEALLAWRNEMLEALRRRRNRHWRTYHQAKVWILRYGLWNERGCLLAEVCDVCEEEAVQMDSAIERLSNLTPDDWAAVLEFFRTLRKAA